MPLACYRARRRAHGPRNDARTTSSPSCGSRPGARIHRPVRPRTPTLMTPSPVFSLSEVVFKFNGRRQDGAGRFLGGYPFGLPNLLPPCPNIFYRVPKSFDTLGKRPRFPCSILPSKALNFHACMPVPFNRLNGRAESLKADPQLSNREHAQRAGTSHAQVGRIRKALEESGQLDHWSSRISADGRERPASQPPRPEPEPETTSEPEETAARVCR